VGALEKEIDEPMEESIEEPTEELGGESNEEPADDESEELIEELIEESKEEPIEEVKEKHKKVAMGVVISICSLLVIYFGMTKYFTERFYFGSEINSISVSAKTVEDAKMEVESQLQNYTLNLKGRGEKIEQIKAADVGLRYSSDEEFEKFKDRQVPFKWFFALFTSKDSKITLGLSYDVKLLKERIDKLSYFESNSIIDPENPSFHYLGNGYVVVDGALGNKVDKDILHSRVAEAILRGEAEIDLETAGCYIKSKYNSNSEKIIEAKNVLNKYVSSKITYTFGESKEILDGSTINKWLEVDENFKVTVDEKKVKDYIGALSKTYNTIGKIRNFISSSGETINVGGGDYGRSINEAKEAQSLIAAIKEGLTITREPIFSQIAFSQGSDDIGNTYVEIDISKQHIWFYKNGSLITEGDIVTGNVKNNYATPKGIYRLKYKQKHAVLRGPGYAAPVTFWMPFNRGIGIHDASWRSVFGGNIYKTNGSHGCINTPYNVVKEIFNNIEVNTPVICY
jgi:hypothetical protein